MPDTVLGATKAEMKQSNTPPPPSPDGYHLPSCYYVSGLQNDPIHPRLPILSASSVLATNAWHTENPGIKRGGQEQGEVPEGSSRHRQRQKPGKDIPGRTACADCSHAIMKEH